MSRREELRAEIERCIDGDLGRAERRALLEQLAASPDAQEILAEAVALERRMRDLAQAYEQFEPSPAFATAGLAPARLSMPAHIAGMRGRLAAALRHSLSRHLWPALAGAAVATLVLVYAVIPVRDVHMAARMADQLSERIHVLDVPFQTVADNDAWTHSAHIEPGQAVRFEIQASHERDFHLRIVGGGDVDVMLVHSRPNLPDQMRRITGGPVHYASLPRPRKGDVLVVRNDGNTAIDFHVAAVSSSDVAIHPVTPEERDNKIISH